MPAHTFPHAAIATPHYLASSAGLAVMASGGNAVDAAVAANLVLSVVYPHMCGLGGDLFAMVWEEGELAGLNSSGRLPKAAKLEGDTVPHHGSVAATLPGAVAGWNALLDRYGSRAIGKLSRPAARLAREGFPRSPGLKRITAFMREALSNDAEAARIYLADDPLVQKDLANTIEHIDEFYTGKIARNAPKPFAMDDFDAHRAEWVEPLRTEWAGHEICEMPPNSRGHLALRMLEALEPLDGLTPDDAEFHSRMIRAHNSVVAPTAGNGDTIYLCTRDENGMAVSLNQSLFEAFGSCTVIPGTGVLLNNRAAYFKPDEYRGGARPTHTLSPAMALREGKPGLVFGTMGGDAQVQVHLQLLARILVSGQDAGDAVAAPRWRIYPDGLRAEAGLPDIGAQPLPFPDLAGHAHIIQVRDGHIAAAFDPRSDGAALGY